MDRFPLPPATFSNRRSESQKRVREHPVIRLPPSISANALPKTPFAPGNSPGPLFRDRSGLFVYSPGYTNSRRPGGRFGAIGSHLSPSSGQAASETAEQAADYQALKELIESSEADREVYEKLGGRRRGSAGQIRAGFNDDEEVASEAATSTEKDVASRTRPASTLATTEPSRTDQVEGKDWDVSNPDADLPNGSIVYMIKVADMNWMVAAIQKSTWSNKHGANQVMQAAWLKKPEHAKILLLFSTSTHNQDGIFKGLATMTGPYNSRARTTFMASSEHHVRGAIPIKWMVLKDVPFTAFDDLQYNDKPVTQIRHCNTIPGEAGSITIKRYLKAPDRGPAMFHSAMGALTSPTPLEQRAVSDGRRMSSGAWGSRNPRAREPQRRTAAAPHERTVKQRDQRRP